jgi:hypothetical protein
LKIVKENNMTTEELIDLMYTPIYDEKMLKAMEEFEMEIPKLDEQYEIRGRASTSNEQIGLSFFFEELNGLNTNGEPVLRAIGVTEDSEFHLPFGLSPNMSYEECIKTLGKKADYYDSFMDNIDNIYYWILEDSSNGRKKSLSLGFYEENNLLLENGFTISDFIEARTAKRNMIPNDE